MRDGETKIPTLAERKRGGGGGGGYGVSALTSSVQLRYVYFDFRRLCGPCNLYYWVFFRRKSLLLENNVWIVKWNFEWRYDYGLIKYS